MAAGIRGYSWSFPCLIAGRPHLNVGIYDQCPRDAVDDARPKARLLDALAAAFPKLPIPAGGHGGYKAFPIRWYAPQQTFAGARVLLAGDAAGVDPLMGEGISYAFEHAKLAAQAVDGFLAGNRPTRWPAMTTRSIAAPPPASCAGCCSRRGAFTARGIACTFAWLRSAAVRSESESTGTTAPITSMKRPCRSLLAKWAKAVLLGAPMG